MGRVDDAERKVLVLQGGGALGAYQAGAYEALAEAGYQPDWIAGISIGAINAAIIAGNPPERRVQQLRRFWEGITAWFAGAPLTPGPLGRRIFNEIGAATVMMSGVPGFFVPRYPPAGLAPGRTADIASIYDTSPLARTLSNLVDFELLNGAGPRLSVGAVDVANGNFVYFDNSEITIGREHIMASGALPPGFPAVTIDGRTYWDGGLVSNTPLQVVLETNSNTPLCIFQVDLFSARGSVPVDLLEVANREKDIRYSSRTRLTTDRFRQLHSIAAAAERLSAKLPDALRDDPDAAYLRSVATRSPVTLVHLIHRKETYETQSKDYEFSRLTMNEHWAAGRRDVERTLRHKAWTSRRVIAGGIQVFDVAHSKG